MISALTTVGFLNVCSLRGKVAEVTDLMSSRGVEVFGLAASWLKPSIPDGELAINNYNLFRKDRVHRHCGSVCVYCHKLPSVRRRKDLESDMFEIIWLGIGSSHASIRIGCGYRPPNMTQAYWNLFEAKVEGAYFGTHASTILIGDFNADIRFHQATCAVLLHNLITRLCDISDHNAIITRLLTLRSRQHPTPPRLCRKLYNWEAFKDDMRTSFTVSLDQDVDNMVNIFTNSIISELDKHAPLVARRSTKIRHPCPRLTKELVDSVRERNRLHRCLMLDRMNDVLCQEHRNAPARARHMDRRLRNSYFLSQCNTFDQRKRWLVMNTVTGWLSKHQEPKASMVDLNRQLGNVVSDASRPTTFLCPEGPAHEHGLSSFHLVTIDDVQKCLCSVEPTKAVGSDMIPGLVLKSCASVVAEPLTHVFNASLTAGCVSTAFKLYNVSSLYKSGYVMMAKKLQTSVSSSHCFPILEYFVWQQVTDYLTEHKLFPESQFAYRRQHSTEDAVVLAINRWLIAKAERKYTGVVMMVMSKAFDRVQHARLVSVLFIVGSSGRVLLWFSSYLSDRSQCVQIGDTISASTICPGCVSQGSVRSGPLLFFLYTSEIASVLPTSLVHQEFADDIIIDCSDRDPTFVCSELTITLTRLADWLDEMGLLLNATKTQVMP